MSVLIVDGQSFHLTAHGEGPDLVGLDVPPPDVEPEGVESLPTVVILTES